MINSEAAAEVSPKNKTLYVKAEDLPVWEKAEELAGRQSMSALVTDLLRNWVEEQGRNRVVLEVDDDDGRGRHKVAFYGRQLLVFENAVGNQRLVYQTAKGRLAIYDGNVLRDYDDIQAVERNHRGLGLTYQIAEALKREYIEERDI